MPRGQDAPVRTGGQIDPYVASSIQQGRQQAENRMLTAMQEAGATSRANAANRTALAQTQIQANTQRQMQAAELEAQDKRAAEAERARREDNEFSKTMQETSQSFQAEQAKLNREYDDAVRQEEWDRADKIYEQMEAARRFDYELDLDSSERTTNAILSMVKVGMQQESGREKAMTALSQQEEQFERDQEVYNTTINRTIEGFDTDKRMDNPFKAGIDKPAITLVQPITGSGFPIPTYLHREAQKTEPTGPDPIGVMQSQINQTGSPISAEELSPDKINTLEDRIANNKIQSQDIRNTMAVIEGTLKVLDKRISSTSADKEVAFWKSRKADVIQMRNSLESLKTSNRKLVDNDNESVGVRVRTALGVNGSSVGSRIKTLKETMGTNDYEALLGEMTKPLQIPALKEITTDMSPYEKKLREQYNAMILRKYPDLEGGK